MLSNGDNATFKFFPQIASTFYDLDWPHHSLSDLMIVCRERDVLVPIMKCQQCHLNRSPPQQFPCYNAILTSMMHVTTSQVRLSLEGISVFSYQKQIVLLPKSSPKLLPSFTVSHVCSDFLSPIAVCLLRWNLWSFLSNEDSVNSKAVPQAESVFHFQDSSPCCHSPDSGLSAKRGNSDAASQRQKRPMRRYSPKLLLCFTSMQTSLLFFAPFQVHLPREGLSGAP